MNSIFRSITVNKIIRIVKKRIILCLFFAVIGASIAGWFGYYDNSRLYYAEVKFFVNCESEYVDGITGEIASINVSTASSLIPCYVRMIRSNEVLGKVVEELQIDYDASQISGFLSFGYGSTVIYMYVYHSDPYVAMSVANCIADVATDEIIKTVKIGGIEVIDYAVLPTNAEYSKDIYQFTLIGAAIGFIASLFICVLVGLLNTTIWDEEEIRRIFTIPVLGSISIMTKEEKQQYDQLISKYDMPQRLKEEISLINMNLSFVQKAERCRTYAFTSTVSGDGKTFACINMAIEMARIGKKTLIIDADMRRSRMGEILELEAEDGFSDCLIDYSDKAVIKTSVDNLDIMLCGLKPPNPVELIISGFCNVLERLKNDYEYIFIDVPSVGNAADTIAISEYISGYIIIAHEGVSTISHEIQTVHALEEVEAKIVGYILNGDIQSYKIRKREKYAVKEKMA